MNIPKLPMKIVIPAIGAVILLIAGIVYLARPTLPRSFASGNGRLEATSVDVVTKIAGRISELVVSEGDTVQKGEVVARLDSRELDAQLKEAQAQVEQAKQQKLYAAAIVAQQASQLSLAKKTLERSKSLYVNNNLSLQELQQDETAEQTAKASLAAAQADVVKYDATIQAAEAQVETIRVNRDESILIAPVSGRVLYKIKELGEMLKAGGSVYTILDLTDVYMNIYLPTDLVGRVAMGSEARILLDAIPNFPVAGKVTFIEPQAQFTPKDVETKSEREKMMFKVKISVNADTLKKYTDQVKSGLPGVAYVRIDTKDEWPDYLKLKE